MLIKTCPNPTCGRPFQVNRYGRSDARAEAWTDITCPHCGLVVGGDGHSAFLTHPLSSRQEADFAVRRQRSQPPALPRVLLVEDDPRDLELTMAALDRCGIPHELAVARDGRQAIAALAACGREAERPEHYQLVLLDLRLPEVDGLDVLQTIRSTPSTAQTPVVVISTSDDEHDLDRAYRLAASAYIVKPSDVRTLSMSLGKAFNEVFAA